MVGRDVSFKVGDRALPFTAEGFLMSFSLPNFFFHATTAYDILRHRGVPLGKRDFMGRLKLKREQDAHPARAIVLHGRGLSPCVSCRSVHNERRRSFS